MTNCQMEEVTCRLSGCIFPASVGASNAGCWWLILLSIIFLSTTSFSPTLRLRYTYTSVHSDAEMNKQNQLTTTIKPYYYWPFIWHQYIHVICNCLFMILLPTAYLCAESAQYWPKQPGSITVLSIAVPTILVYEQSIKWWIFKSYGSLTTLHMESNSVTCSVSVSPPWADLAPTPLKNAIVQYFIPLRRYLYQSTLGQIVVSLFVLTCSLISYKRWCRSLHLSTAVSLYLSISYSSSLLKALENDSLIAQKPWIDLGLSPTGMLRSTYDKVTVPRSAKVHFSMSPSSWVAGVRLEEEYYEPVWAIESSDLSAEKRDGLLYSWSSYSLHIKCTQLHSDVRLSKSSVYRKRICYQSQ